MQHLVIGWVSALPLLIVLLFTQAERWPVMTGAAYGAAYYVAINSLALPIYFNDPLPWQLGASTVLPSLIGHVIFGAVIGRTSRHFATRTNPRRVVT